MFWKKKGRILKMKMGINPNSSSIGTDLSWFLMGAIALTVAVNLMDAGIRLWFGRVNGKGHEKN